MRERGGKGQKVYVYIERKEVGPQSGDSGDTIDFKGFFLSPLLLRGGDNLRGGDKFEVVTAQTKRAPKRMPFQRPSFF